jgi:hypothetical protein
MVKTLDTELLVFLRTYSVFQCSTDVPSTENAILHVAKINGLLVILWGFCTKSNFPPSKATSYVGEKMKEKVGERIGVTIVNRDVPFIYIKYKWKKWKGKTLPPQRPVHKVQCLLDWMMKKKQQALQHKGRVLICHLGPNPTLPPARLCADRPTANSPLSFSV